MERKVWAAEMKSLAAWGGGIRVGTHIPVLIGNSDTRWPTDASQHCPWRYSPFFPSKSPLLTKWSTWTGELRATEVSSPALGNLHCPSRQWSCLRRSGGANAEILVQKLPALRPSGVSPTGGTDKACVTSKKYSVTFKESKWQHSSCSML